MYGTGLLSGGIMTCPSPRLKSWVMKETRDAKSILDLGCGTKWYWEAFCTEGQTVVGVDAYAPFGPHHILDLELESLPFDPESFDVILMLDFIEHLSRHKGEQVMEDAKVITRDKILMVTPLIWNDNSENVNDPTSNHFGNEYDFHKSLWTLEDFPMPEWKREHMWKNGRYTGQWRKRRAI